MRCISSVQKLIRDVCRLLPGYCQNRGVVAALLPKQGLCYRDIAKKQGLWPGYCRKGRFLAEWDKTAPSAQLYHLIAWAKFYTFLYNEKPEGLSRADAQVFKSELIQEVVEVFYASTAQKAQQARDEFIELWQDTQPELVATLKRDWEESIAC